MSVAPFPIQVLRDSKWSVLQSDELLPGDVVSLGIYSILSAPVTSLTQSSAQSSVRNQYSSRRALNSRNLHRE
jgi:magnesium-transporting ATPase (P-type)